MSFSEQAWERTSGLRAAIDDLAFLRELADGSLDPAAFRHYLEQDALYLAGYARALALLAARAPDTAAAGFWARSAHTTGVVEAALHEDLLSGALLDPAAADPAADPTAAPSRSSPRPSPTCLGYTCYLVAAAATAPYAVAAAAVLPCFWVYADVARRLAAAATAAAAGEHPYARWVAAYDAEEFQGATARARALVDDAALAQPTLVPAMHEAFRTAVAFEHAFWAAAHARERWPLDDRDGDGAIGEDGGAAGA
ncbi:TenA family transcriptional regulator [Quadrisphaera sp. DSM 44207]|uniref:TenA family transcriptional regulator n=1 Tax=Quadrisphaera sp. DSM 44207 TaxID=1881057 RepID=UPI00088373A0|nr:thiaminase /4-amino-5-aminomethyl-2-methylpyrimidine deaminase [Quadrisphaera sp. DSM 44207]